MACHRSHGHKTHKGQQSVLYTNCRWHNKLDFECLFMGQTEKTIKKKERTFPV